MRITGGKYRGRQIKCPPGVIRPAMDRMRESLFSILGNLDGKSFLDLFSGSGIVGLEAASRGAGPVVLVEKDPGKRKVINENLLIAEEKISLFIMPVQRFFRQPRGAYDIVYLDPPFAMPGKQHLLEEIAARELARPGGLVIIHYPFGENWPETIDAGENAENRLTRRDMRKYGGSGLVFYRREP